MKMVRAESSLRGVRWMSGRCRMAWAADRRRAPRAANARTPRTRESSRSRRSDPSISGLLDKVKQRDIGSAGRTRPCSAGCSTGSSRPTPDIQPSRKHSRPVADVQSQCPFTKSLRARMSRTRFEALYLRRRIDTTRADTKSHPYLGTCSHWCSRPRPRTLDGVLRVARIQEDGRPGPVRARGTGGLRARS